MNQDRSTVCKGQGGVRPGTGRPKGSTNKRTEDIEAMLERLDCNPLEVLAMIAINDKEGLGEDKDISIALRQKAASDLMPYIAPMLRATQVEFSDSREDQRLIVQLGPELAAKLNKAAGESIDFRALEVDETPGR
jgi:hypothetical protein